MMRGRFFGTKVSDRYQPYPPFPLSFSPSPDGSLSSQSFHDTYISPPILLISVKTSTIHSLEENWDVYTRSPIFLYSWNVCTDKISQNSVPLGQSCLRR